MKQVDDKSDPNNWKLTATDPDGKVGSKTRRLGVPTNVGFLRRWSVNDVEDGGPAGYTGEWVCKRAVTPRELSLKQT